MTPSIKNQVLTSSLRVVHMERINNVIRNSEDMMERRGKHDS
jgi:hypothetical protein